MIFGRRGVSFRSYGMVLVILLLGFAVDGWSQALSLRGTVRDADGVVPAATVVLSSGDNQLSTVMTDGNGAYSFPSLAVGSYELSASKPGFDPATRTVSL